MPAVGYFRVSTQAQGRSGLGLQAQKAAVEHICRERRQAILVSFTEIESGRRSDRPELLKALHHCKITGSLLVIAKLDRLSRNAAFLLTLRDSGVRFLAADIPDANDLTIGLLAVVAEAERQAISVRTREALAVVAQQIRSGEPYVSKRSGLLVKRLGNPKGASAFFKARKVENRSGQRADQFAADLLPVINSMKTRGFTSTSGIARELNRLGVLTARKRQWHPSTVRNLLARITILEAISSSS